MSTATLTRSTTAALDNDKAARFVGLMSVTEYQEFDCSEPERWKCEYEDGKVFYMLGSSHEHNRIAMNLTGFVFTTVEALGDAYEALGESQKVRIRPGRYAYSDLMIVEGVAQFDMIDALLNPCAVFEVLSPSTQAEDQGSKFAEYQPIETLRHYVLITNGAISITE